MTIKYIYNEPVNLFNSCNVASDTNDWLNVPLIIDIEYIVKRARLRYTCDYLTPGLCSLTKPASGEKILFPAQIHTVML